MKKTVRVAIGIALVFLSIGPRSDAPDPGIVTGFLPAPFEAGPGWIPAAGAVRVVTAYNVGVREQTSDDPCIGASGYDLCRLVARGLNVCAANFVDLVTILRIEGYGECLVLDRMSRRYLDRVDIAMRKDEIGRAIEFGVQRRYVEVKTGRR